MRRLVAMCAMVTAAMLVPAGAEASSANYTLTKTWDAGVPGCVGVRLSGRLDATDDFYISGAGHLVYVKKNPRLSGPKARVTVRKSCGGKARKATKVTVKQYWHYNTCSVNPNLSVSVPWAAAVSLTPTCGNKRVAYRSTTYGKGSDYEQNISGKVAQWKKSVDWASGNAPLKLCVRGAADVTVYFGTKSYSKRIDMGKACV